MMGLNTILHNLLNCPGLVVIGFGLLLTGMFAGAALCAYCACGDGKRLVKRADEGNDGEGTRFTGTPVVF